MEGSRECRQSQPAVVPAAGRLPCSPAVPHEVAGQRPALQGSFTGCRPAVGTTRFRRLRPPRWCSASAWPRSSALPRPGPG
ncbi:hypothetical protein F9K92_00125 [Stenotrophomonas rhizophila]|uniref:Uncharacterized protein n=1 Tax=Stenotrophomonas rhizophila TaxID=216778 RepID=A0A7V7YKR2_9GAMM|nr:hypothetical protein F9K92_00125 [Stenotrophomonas rhizophila]